MVFKGPSIFKRFGRAHDGATAVEFGILAAPFFGLVFGIIEVGLMFFVSVATENAVQQTVRDIRTGRFHASEGNEDTFRDAICARMVNLVNCELDIFFDIRAFPEFSDIIIASPLNEEGEFDPDTLTFEEGLENDVIVAQIFIMRRIISPFVGRHLSDGPNDSRLIMSVATFRNEPFGDVEDLQQEFEATND